MQGLRGLLGSSGSQERPPGVRRGQFPTPAHLFLTLLLPPFVTATLPNAIVTSKTSHFSPFLYFKHYPCTPALYVGSEHRSSSLP